MVPRAASDQITCVYRLLLGLDQEGYQRSDGKQLLTEEKVLALYRWRDEELARRAVKKFAGEKVHYFEIRPSRQNLLDHRTLVQKVAMIWDDHEHFKAYPKGALEHLIAFVPRTMDEVRVCETVVAGIRHM